MLNDTPTPSNTGKAMMCGKFSGKGSSTTTKTVKAADSSSGARTSAASRSRHKATNRITPIASTADTAAERNAPTMVALVASIVTAVARGGPRQHLHARPAVRQQPVAGDVRRHRRQVDRLRPKRCAEPIELVRQEAGQRGVGGQQLRIPTGNKLPQIAGDGIQRMTVREHC